MQTRTFAGALAVLAAFATFAARDASADDADREARRERCATRVSIALLGESPSAQLRDAEDPQAEVAALLQAPSFRERFARFVNATHNREPGEEPGQDASYWATKHVLEKGLPWSDLFLGRFNIVQGDDDTVNVVDDPYGLGYFRSYKWLERYAGNEKEGLKISTAYRIAHDTIGLTLTATTNAPNTDTSATGRSQGACAGCHQNGWYPLDKVAAVLTRRNDTTDEISFDPPRGGPQTILDGVTVSHDGELVQALVNSDAYRFRQCRLAFNYLYARDENQCEGPIFDVCMAELTSKGTIQAALTAIATHPSFCQ